MTVKEYPSKKELAISFAKYLAKEIAKKDSMHIALSGGSTPKIVFDELAENYKSAIDWSQVHLYWGDERCVAPTDDDSNYKMTVTHLIAKIDIPEENIHRIMGENTPAAEAVRYAEVLRSHVAMQHDIPKFDLVLLGMGDDGHTASIFPHEIDLWHSDKLCEVAIHPDSGQKRISITGQVINHAETVAFLVTGENKADKIEEIFHKNGGVATYPASLVAPKTEKLLWFLDAAAASKINATQF